MHQPINIDIESLRTWFLDTKRQFPWRQNVSAYEVLVSEIMLQQTQASRVIPFYLRWIERFPTIHTLANASLDRVYKEWEGLGYYSRARALHNIAKQVVAQYEGQLPCNAEGLSALAGLGPYTVNALLAFAFHQNVAAVDANVIRVITRLFAIGDDVAKQKTKKIVQDAANSLIPAVNGYEIAEAFIELGATACVSKKPKCTQCPLQASCKSYLTNQVDTIPLKSSKTVYEKLFRDVAVIVCDNEILLRRGETGKIMAGLYEFPYFESAPDGFFPDQVRKNIEEAFSLDARFEMAFPHVLQSFTRFRVCLYPKLFLSKKQDIVGFEWHHIKNAATLAFSSGHKRVFEELSRSFKYL